LQRYYLILEIQLKLIAKENKMLANREKMKLKIAIKLA
jgi:2C-methyl-D-erythritol 2,4-cyclodiphosphate synthase